MAALILAALLATTEGYNVQYRSKIVSSGNAVVIDVSGVAMENTESNGVTSGYFDGSVKIPNPINETISIINSFVYTDGTKNDIIFPPSAICDLLSNNTGVAGAFFSKIAESAGTGCPLAAGSYDVTGATLDLSAITDIGTYRYLMDIFDGSNAKIQTIGIDFTVD